MSKPKINWEKAKEHVLKKMDLVCESGQFEHPPGEWDIKIYFENYPPRIILTGILKPSNKTRDTNPETGHATYIKDEEYQQIAGLAADIADFCGFRAKHIGRLAGQEYYHIQPDYSQWEEKHV